MCADSTSRLISGDHPSGLSEARVVRLDRNHVQRGVRYAVDLVKVLELLSDVGVPVEVKNSGCEAGSGVPHRIQGCRVVHRLEVREWVGFERGGLVGLGEVRRQCGERLLRHEVGRMAE